MLNTELAQSLHTQTEEYQLKQGARHLTRNHNVKFRDLCINPMMNILVFQLHYGLHCPVVVIEVDGSDHLGPFQVSYLHCHFADGVAANEFHHLLGCCVPRVHFNGGKLDVLKRQNQGHAAYMITA